MPIEVSDQLDEILIEQLARQFAAEHGDAASSETVKLAAKMLERQDYDAYRIWTAVWAATRDLQWPVGPV